MSIIRWLFKLVRPRGFIIVSKHVDGSRSWMINNQVWTSKPDQDQCNYRIDRVVKSDIYRSTVHCRKVRRIDWITEIPKAEIRPWKDILLPILFSVVLLALLAYLTRTLDDSLLAAWPLSIYLIGLACATVPRFAGEYLSRAIPPGPSYTPRTKTVLLDQGVRALVMLILTIAGFLAFTRIPDQSIFSILTELKDIIAPKMFWTVLGILSLIEGFATSLLGQYVASLSTTHKMQTWRKNHTCLRRLESMLTWRVYLAFIPCPHPETGPPVSDISAAPLPLNPA